MSEAAIDAAFNQFPIITYTNRLQRQMDKITFLMSNTTNINAIVNSLLMLLVNLTPEAKRDLHPEYDQLIGYERNINTIETFKDAVEIYGKVSDWIYNHLLQDALKFRPKNPKQAHIGSGPTGET
jgi:hypothetical protein